MPSPLKSSDSLSSDSLSSSFQSALPLLTADESERFHHMPDSRLMLWPELDFLPINDVKYRQSFNKVQDQILNNPNLKACELLWYVSNITQTDKKKGREIFKQLLKQFSDTGIMTTSVNKAILPLSQNLSSVVNGTTPNNMSMESDHHLHKSFSTQGSESSLISTQFITEMKFLGNFPDSQSLVHFIFMAFKLSKLWATAL